MTFTRIPLLFLLCAIAGCVQKPITDYNPARDFLSLHTYVWSEKKLTSEQDAIVNNALTDQRVHQAVDDVLASQNFKKAEAAQADFLVTYHLAFSEKINANTVGMGFGFGNPGFMLGGNVAVSQYQETELFIDMLDPHTHELIWRGSVKYPTQTDASPELRAEQIRKNVTFILSAFPPSR